MSPDPRGFGIPSGDIYTGVVIAADHKAELAKRDELLRRAKEIISFGMYADTMQQWLTDYNRLMSEETKTDD
ncbi:MAG TPA: hypothetical protein VKP88_02820 [Candidatus Paceibacterota bacterium]|nr:hypothetical protein [Candidatus Paceibacterota bacterium]